MAALMIVEAVAPVHHDRLAGVVDADQGNLNRVTLAAGARYRVSSSSEARVELVTIAARSPSVAAGVVYEYVLTRCRQLALNLRAVSSVRETGRRQGLVVGSVS